MAPSPLLLVPRRLVLFVFPVLIELFFSIPTHCHALALATATSSSKIQCRSGWTNTLQIIHASQINDGYCDCPYDNADEPNTSACSGAMDGMWAGLSITATPSTDDATATNIAYYYFHCPQQPNLHLPLSRVNDGICDCCDGADEILLRNPASSSSNNSADTTLTTTSCPNICDDVLAEERAANAKSKSDFIIGHKIRLDSISQYQQWHTDSQDKLRNLKEVELVASIKDESDVEQLLREAKLNFARMWLANVAEQVAMEPLLQIFDDEENYNDFDLAIFTISLCALSAEITPDNVGKNGRCVAFDRASLDVGILWKYEKEDEGDATSSGNNSGNNILPAFDRLTPAIEDELIDYANQILSRLDGAQENAQKNTKSARRNDSKRGRRERKEIRSEPEDESDDDYAIHDIDEDWDDKSQFEDEGGEQEVKDEGGKDDGIIEQTLKGNQALVMSLLKKVPVDRSLFKQQSRLLLDYELDQSKDDEEAEGAKANDEHQSVDRSASPQNRVDPMALTMVKSTISKNLSQITRGETSAASAARFVASIMLSSQSARRDLINLAIMTMYHANITSEDAAELIYLTSSGLRITQEGSVSETSCAASWSSMCPPRTIQVGGKTYPPVFLVEAAAKRCDQRQTFTADVCKVDDDEMEFPTSIPDGYYHYFTTQSRGDGDALTPYFLITVSLCIVPSELAELRTRKDSIDENRTSLMKRISDLETEIGDINGVSSKYGVDGELFILRGTCHKLEHGKYEYEVCIFGQATQRDIGQKNGGTNLGSWEAESVEGGQRKLKWGGGTKCWNGPVRSAEVFVTCGAETKLVTADEPETCRYVLTMESPIGCDEDFKMRAMLEY